MKTVREQEMPVKKGVVLPEKAFHNILRTSKPPWLPAMIIMEAVIC